MTVEAVSRAQNSFTIDVVAQRPGARVLLNTVYDDNWKTSIGRTVNLANQLAIDLPEAGRFHVTARARPRTFVAGAMLTVLGIAGTVTFFVRDARRRRRERAGVS